MNRLSPACCAALLALAAPLLVFPRAAGAEIALSANDNKLVLDNGATRTARNRAMREFG